MIYSASTFKYAFDYKAEDVYWYNLEHFISIYISIPLSEVYIKSLLIC